jgi:cell division protein FtsN
MMNDTVDRELALEEEDRLPWLEAVDNDDAAGVSTAKLLTLLGAAVLAIAVVVGGVWWLRSQQGGSGDSTLIAAQAGDYKSKPDDAGGMKVEGQGDTAFATSEGAEAAGKVDTTAQPEAPVAGGTAATAAAGVKPVVGASATTAVAAGGALVAKPPVVGVTAAPTAQSAAAPGTGLVQLGAYNSEASANQAYAALAARHSSLTGLSKTVVPAAVGGTTMYRLRVSAGGNASTVCSKLKAAGANCIIVK